MSYQAYARLQKATEAPRDLEIRAISFVTSQLIEADAPGADAMTRIRALNANMKLWSILVQDLESAGNGLPHAIKVRYVSIGHFVRRRCMAALMDQGGLADLVGFNTDILDALNYQRQAVAA